MGCSTKANCICDMNEGPNVALIYKSQSSTQHFPRFILSEWKSTKSRSRNKFVNTSNCTQDQKLIQITIHITNTTTALPTLIHNYKTKMHS